MSVGLVFIVALTLGVIFVNGWTDAPNAIATAVSTRSLTARNGVILAAVMNFVGVFGMTMINDKVAESISKMFDFEKAAQTSGDANAPVVALAAAMFAIVLWAVIAWYFGIPTSESHALIAGLTGSAIALGGLSAVNMNEWQRVFVGLGVSSVMGMGSGYIIAKIVELCCRRRNRRRSNSFFRFGEKIFASIMAILHGAQDGQKFMAVFMLGLYLNGLVSKDASGAFDIPAWVMILCSLIMGLGTSIGGYRIIKSVGMDMVKLEVHQGFASDVAGAVCLLFSSLKGIPLSTTHTKTMSMVGVACSRRASSVDWSVVKEMGYAWVLTFPLCGFVGFVMTKIFLFIF